MKAGAEFILVKAGWNSLRSTVLDGCGLQNASDRVDKINRNTSISKVK